jgi:hypothetical protein
VEQGLREPGPFFVAQSGRRWEPNWMKNGLANLDVVPLPEDLVQGLLSGQAGVRVKTVLWRSSDTDARPFAYVATVLGYPNHRVRLAAGGVISIGGALLHAFRLPTEERYPGPQRYNQHLLKPGEQGLLFVGKRPPCVDGFVQERHVLIQRQRTVGCAASRWDAPHFGVKEMKCEQFVATAKVIEHRSNGLNSEHREHPLGEVIVRNRYTVWYDRMFPKFLDAVKGAVGR